MLIYVGTARPGTAQHIPGANRDLQGEAREDRAKLLRDANRVMGQWQTAWASKDAKSLARLYAENAFLRMPNGIHYQGRRAIEGMLGDSLANSGNLVLSLADWEPGDMVYISGQFTLGSADAEQPPLSGFHFVVLKLVGGSYKIRSQTFVPDPPADS